MTEATESAEAILTLSKRSWIEASQQTAEITESKFLALDHLAEVGTATVGETQQRIQVVPAQMSRILRRLESSELTSSDINRDDRRRGDITITDAGRAVHARYRDAKLAPIIAALNRLTESERSQFMALVRKMTSR